MTAFSDLPIWADGDWEAVHQRVKEVVGDRGPKMLYAEHMEYYVGSLRGYSSWEPSKFRTECLNNLLGEIRHYRQVHRYYECV